MTSTEITVHSFELKFSGPVTLTIKKRGEPERVVEIDTAKVGHAVHIDAEMFDSIKTCARQYFLSMAIDPCAQQLVSDLAGAVAEKMAEFT